MKSQPAVTESHLQVRAGVTNILIVYSFVGNIYALAKITFLSIHIWCMQPQLSYDNTCRIRMWFWTDKQCLDSSEKLEKSTTGANLVWWVLSCDNSWYPWKIRYLPVSCSGFMKLKGNKYSALDMRFTCFITYMYAYFILASLDFLCAMMSVSRVTNTTLHFWNNNWNIYSYSCNLIQHHVGLSFNVTLVQF